MIQWFLTRMGVDAAITSRLEHATFSFAQPLVFWLGLVALLPVGWLVFRRHERNFPFVTPLARHALTTCRIGVLLVLVLVLAGPRLAVHEPEVQKPILAFLINGSASMELPAGPIAVEQAGPLAQAAGLIDAPDAPAEPDGDPSATVASGEIRKQLDAMTRTELMMRVLHTQDAVLKGLGERCELRFYRFAHAVARGGSPEAPDDASVSRLGQTTAIGTALKCAIAEASGQPVAGIVILSDGRLTAGPNPLHLVGEDGDAAGIPIWCIPVGSRRGIDDVSLLSIVAPWNVSRGDRVDIVATVRAQGFVGMPAEIELVEGDDVLDRAAMTLGAGEEQSVKLGLQAEKAGTRILTVRVTTFPGETVTRNNTQQVTLQIDEQTWRVLYIEGWPRWDFRFLDHAVRRDHGLDVTMVMESQIRAKRRMMAEARNPEDEEGEAGEQADPNLPSLTELADLPSDVDAIAAYDVVVLGDVSPELMTPSIQKALAQAVAEKGVGLILQAGTQYQPHAYRGLPLGDVLPLDVDVGEVGQGGMFAEAFSPFTLSITDAGFMCAAFRPYDQLANNREIWGRMPELFWAMRATGLGPATRVLAEVKTLDGVRPLIAERYVGKGRVYLVGTDSTYRWKKNIGDLLFYPFWGRTFRHLAQSRHRQTGTSWVNAYPRRAELGESVDIEMYALGAGGAPLTGGPVDVRISATGTPETSSVTLSPCGEPGWFRGVWQPHRTGDFRLTYRDAAGKAATADVRVAESEREFLRPSADWQGMGQLADASGGGGRLSLGESAQLGELVQGQPTDIARDYEAPLWDNWLVLLIVAGLYCLDIAVRRLLGLT